uniref:Protein kinase c conserved region 1 n=2 Tax=Culex tarsalis TaxID=7177 RepID=A0A1Q3FVE2_CULTA
MKKRGAGDLTMDTFVMLLFALIVVVIALVFLSKLLYDKYVKKGGSVTAEGGASTTTSTTAGIVAGSSALLPSKDGGAVGLRLSEPKEVLATKKEALLAQARNGGALGGGARVGGGLGGGGGGAAFGPKAGGFGGGAGGGGGVALRKRISRKSPGPELTQKKRTIVPPSNINGSDIQSVQWAIHMFRWLYSDLVVVNKLLQDWVGTVNTALLSYVEQHEMIVEVVRILPESLPPNMPSILCEPAEQPNEVELMFDLEATPVLQIKAFKSTNQKTDVSHYKATVSRLKTRMSLIINFFALKGEMKVEGFPDIKIHLNSIGPLKTANAQDEKKQGDLIVELLSSSIRDVVYPIDFSIYSTCPRLMGEEPEEMTPLDYSAYGQYDTYRSYQDDSFGNSASASPRKLLVKIIKAEGLLQCSQPFCVAEMDEPAQKHQSACKMGPNPYWDDTFLFDLSNSSTELLFEVYDSVAVGNVNAVDDDDVNAVLNVDPVLLVDQSANVDGGGTDAVTPSKPSSSLDVVVESADKIVALHDDNTTPTNNSNDPPPKCVVDELPNLDKQPTNGSVPDGVAVVAASAAQDDEPQVAGDAVEPEKAAESDVVDSAGPVVKTKNKCGFQKFLGLGLVGIDELSNGPASTQVLELQPRPYETENISGTLTVEFVFIDGPPAPAPRRQHMQQSFRAGEDALSTSTPKSTLAGHLTAQGIGTGKQLQIASAPTSPAKSGLTSSVSFADRNQRFQAANTNRLNNSFLKPPSVSDYGLNGTRQQSESTPVSPALSSASQQSYTGQLSASAPESISKLEKKPRNIFGTLRNKLTLSKKSKSMDCPEYGGPTYPGQIHSASSTLSRGSSMDQRSNIFPNIKNLSRKSSISESSAVSGISNASGRTYVHEESTLLLETTENNVVRHYLVPIEVAVRQKSWKRKGTKLHVYNDHTFIAKHIRGGILCHVCHRSILRRPGKQGYECRDCLIQCHKPCHVRAPQACPNPKILSMQLASLPVLNE